MFTFWPFKKYSLSIFYLYQIWSSKAIQVAALAYWPYTSSRMVMMWSTILLVELHSYPPSYTDHLGLGWTLWKKPTAQTHAALGKICIIRKTEFSGTTSFIETGWSQNHVDAAHGNGPGKLLIPSPSKHASAHSSQHISHLQNKWDKSSKLQLSAKEDQRQPSARVSSLWVSTNLLLHLPAGLCR